MTKVLGLIIGLLVIVGGTWWWVNTQSVSTEDKMMNEEKMMEPAMETVPPAMMDKKDESMTEHESMMMERKAYVAHSEEVLKQGQDTRRVLFFYASWCPFCQGADADFEKNMASIPSDITVIRVNYNDPDTDASEKELARQYGVTYQHSFVQIDAMGKAVAAWNGGGLEKLMQNIK